MHGQFKEKKKKVWIPMPKQKEGEEVEIEVEIIDYSDLIIEKYDKNGNLILEIKKEKNLIDLSV
tara:strand:+ start:268 stop:459 length:192 start_codon:yes stop_codon:yes gene_type:complete